MESYIIWFIQAVILSAFGLVIWFMQNNITNTREDLIELRNEIANVKSNYLHKDDFKEFKTELRNIFNEIKNDIRSLGNHNKGDS
jgi:uncharacterized membrane protein YhiD involved in acid resistance